MENYPTISVIIPAFNAASYIQQCIENILAQTYKTLEIIVIDDGSTDNTAEIAKQYPLKLIQQQHQGVSVARNAGMAAASGEYLHFMDVDDLINLNFYERLLDAIAPHKADMALSGFIHERIPGFTSLITEKFIYINPEDKLIFSNAYHQGQVAKYLFKTSFLKERKLTFDQHLRNAQDRVFAIQAVYFSNKLVTAPGTVYYYKERQNSLETSSTEEKIRKREQDKKLADAYCENFVRQHQIKKFRTPRYVTFRYTFLGLPIFKKNIYNTGRVKWYFLGLYFLKRKKSNKL